MQFNRVAGVFKREGLDPWIFSSGVTMVSVHILAEIVDNRDGSYCKDAPHIPNLLCVEVDDYEPMPGQCQWDAEVWADRQTVLYSPATRECWRLVHATARKLQRALPAVLNINGVMAAFAPGSVTVLEVL